MTSDSSTRLWAMRAGFTMLTLLILIANMLPIETSVPDRWAGADLLLAFAFAWSLRRPDFMPVALLAALFLLADLLLQRPPGVWALLMLLACERLKAQAHVLRDAGLPTEFLTVGVLIVGVYVLNRLILAVTLVDLPPLGLYLTQMIFTLLAYPLAVFVSHVFLGVRKQSVGDLGTGGAS